MTLWWLSIARFTSVVGLLALSPVWLLLSPTTPVPVVAVPSADQCWVGVSVHSYDDLRGGPNTFATFVVEFWRGEKFVVEVAKAGETISGKPKAMRFPALPLSTINGIRRITLSYRLDPGDGLLRQADTWHFYDPTILHYCVDTRFSAGDDPFLKNPYSYRELGTANNSYGAQGPIRKLSGAGTITIYDNPNPDPLACRTDADCSDRVMCNGVEVCRPGKPGSDARGCRAGPPVRCGLNETCLESARDIYRACTRNDCLNSDKDGDGFPAVECGGQDCDDNNRNRFPTNPEIWDDQNNDEDCDLTSNGSARFFNASQVCDGENNVIQIPTLRRAACSRGSVCVPQPFSGGVCAGRPKEYVAPPRFSAPLEQTFESPGNRRLKQKIPPTIPPILRPLDFFEY